MIIAGNSNVSLFRNRGVQCAETHRLVSVHWVGALRIEHFFHGHPAAARVRSLFSERSDWKWLSIGTHDAFEFCRAVAAGKEEETLRGLLDKYQTLFHEFNASGRFGWICFPQAPHQTQIEGLTGRDVVRHAQQFFSHLYRWCQSRNIPVVFPQAELLDGDGMPRRKWLQRDEIHLNASALPLYLAEIRRITGQNLTINDSGPEENRGLEPRNELESFAILVGEELGLPWESAGCGSLSGTNLQQRLLDFLSERLQLRGIEYPLTRESDFVGNQLMDSLDLVETFAFAAECLGMAIPFDVSLKELNTVEKLSHFLQLKKPLSINDLLRSLLPSGSDASQQEAISLADARIGAMGNAMKLRLTEIVHGALGGRGHYGFTFLWQALAESGEGQFQRALSLLDAAQDSNLRFPVSVGRADQYRQLWKRTVAGNESNLLPVDVQAAAPEIAGPNTILDAPVPAEVLALREAAKTLQSPESIVQRLRQQGERLMSQGKQKAARYAFQKTLQIDSQNVTAARNLGILFWQDNRNDEAFQYFDRARVLNPKDRETVLSFGGFLAASGRTYEMEALCCGYLKMCGTDTEVQSLMQTGEAGPQMRTQQETRIGSIDIPAGSKPLTSPTLQQWTLQGFKFFETSDWPAALSCFDAVVDQEPGRQGIQFLRARCLVNLGRTDEARKAAQAELANTPSHPDARQLLTELGVGANEESPCTEARSSSPGNHLNVASQMPVADPTVSNLATQTTATPSLSVNETLLHKQRAFWNVSTIREAMFERVYSSATISKMSPEEQRASFEKSALESVRQILTTVPWNPNWKVLEIGCGVGRVVKPMRERFAQVDGVDIAANMIEFARQYLEDGKQNGRLLVNNGSDLQPLSDQYYDLVYSMIVFQHIRSLSVIRSYFRDVFRVMKPGGYFRLQVYDKSNAALGSFSEEARPDVDYGMAGNGYSPEELQLLFSEHGFELVELEHTRPWVWATARRPITQAGSEMVSRGGDVSNLVPSCTDAGQSAALAGFRHLEERNWKQALACFEEALKAKPQTLGLNFQRARCLFHLEHSKDAERAIFAELKLKPDHADARQLLRASRTRPRTAAEKNQESQTPRAEGIRLEPKPNRNGAGLHARRIAIGCCGGRGCTATSREVESVVEFTNEPLPFGGGTLDYVFASFCPEHLPSARSFLEEISRVARDGATLDIWFSCANDFTDPLRASVGSWGEGIFEQVCLRSPEVWRQSLKKAWLWQELNYCIASETLQVMELHRIDLAFAVKYFKNVVHEMNLVVELRNDLAVPVSHPRRTHSANRQGPRIQL